MSKALASWVLILWFVASISAADNVYSGCDCYEEGFWSIESILVSQKVSDFLIAVAYFSIPIELLYFITCSAFPFKWVIIEFIFFIVLCGMTHFLNGWTYGGQYTFQLMLALTIFKGLTALVSCATSISLVTLFPMLMKVKVRESMLMKKTWDLGREVGIIKQQKEAGRHVRMLTQEIRKSLDRHTILYTTLNKLSEALDLLNCAIWMPDASRTEMNLTHELQWRSISITDDLSIPVGDPDVRRIEESDEVEILDPDSELATRSSTSGESGPVAAIRMPMLCVSDFRGGTPEMIRTCHAILVLVLPGGQCRSWDIQELEIVKVVADQVAVALSHAAVLEESQLVREKLVEQNRALQLAKQDAMKASQARNSFQMVMSHGLRRPMHSVTGLLSMMQDENLNSEQRIVIDAMVKSSNVLSVLINDVMDTSPKDSGRFPIEMRSFSLRSMVKEAACLAQCLCIYKDYGFSVEVEKTLPDNVMGDERRIFQVILYMVGNLLNGNNGGGFLTFGVFSEKGSQGRNDQRWANWNPKSSDGYVCVKFETGIKSSDTQSVSSGDWRYFSGRIEEGLSFSMCRKLVQMMQGNIWVVPNPVDLDRSVVLVLRFQLRPSIIVGVSETGESSEPPKSNSLFRGLHILLADNDNINRAVTRKQLEKLGCIVSVVSFGYECLSAVGAAASPFQIVLMDLHMPDLDGYEVSMRIRKFRSSNWPLIVAVSASDNDDMWKRCLKVGINGLVKKPVHLKGIANELQRVLLKANNVL